MNATRPQKNQLGHERLEVYRIAVRFVAFAAELLNRLPKGHAGLADQLRRAALSIPLNIAEGAGKPSRADAARFYGIARGSALECGAALDVFGAMGLVEEQDLATGKQMLVAQVSMLTKLGQKMGLSKEPEGWGSV